jgi:glucose-6-phosphate 1-dehydrogenase
VANYIRVSKKDQNPANQGRGGSDRPTTKKRVSAYERIFLDLLEGNTTLFVRGDEAEEAWRVSEPILDAWRSGLVPLLEYPAGSEGPTGAALAPRWIGNDRNQEMSATESR